MEVFLRILNSWELLKNFKNYLTLMVYLENLMVGHLGLAYEVDSRPCLAYGDFE